MCAYGHELVVAQVNGGKVHLQFSNQSSFVCDGVVGADGIHSRVRNILVGRSVLTYRGYTVFRGLVDAHPALSPDTMVKVGDQGSVLDSWPSARTRCAGMPPPTPQTASGDSKIAPGHFQFMASSIPEMVRHRPFHHPGE